MNTTETPSGAISKFGVRYIVTVAICGGVGMAIVIVAVLLAAVVMVKRKSKKADLKKSPVYYNTNHLHLMLHDYDGHDAHDSPYAKVTALNSPFIHADADADAESADNTYDYARFDRHHIRTSPNSAYGMTTSEQTQLVISH